MATLDDLVNETQLALMGHGLRNDTVTYLLESVSSTGLQLKVNSVEGIGRGIVEIDDELMWVDAFDRTTGILSIAPFGRGFQGTKAASHAVNSKVTFQPSYTRSGLKTEINNVIRAVFPNLHAVAATTFTFRPSISTYALPNSAESLLSVTFETVGPSRQWAPVRGYRLDTMADIQTFGTSNTITILSGVQAGATVRVTYSVEPDILESDSDDFADTTGLPESAKDVIVLGTVHRVLSAVDWGRIQYQAAEADSQSGRLPVGSATNAAKYVYAVFQQRLSEETAKLQKRFPIRITYSN